MATTLDEIDETWERRDLLFMVTIIPQNSPSDIYKLSGFNVDVKNRVKGKHTFNNEFIALKQRFVAKKHMVVFQLIGLNCTITINNSLQM